MKMTVKKMKNGKSCSWDRAALRSEVPEPYTVYMNFHYYHATGKIPAHKTWYMPPSYYNSTNILYYDMQNNLFLVPYKMLAKNWR